MQISLLCHSVLFSSCKNSPFNVNVVEKRKDHLQNDLFLLAVLLELARLCVFQATTKSDTLYKLLWLHFVISAMHKTVVLRWKT